MKPLSIEKHRIWRVPINNLLSQTVNFDGIVNGWAFLTHHSTIARYNINGISVWHFIHKKREVYTREIDPCRGLPCVVKYFWIHHVQLSKLVRGGTLLRRTYSNWRFSYSDHIALFSGVHMAEVWRVWIMSHLRIGMNRGITRLKF